MGHCVSDPSTPQCREWRARYLTPLRGPAPRPTANDSAPSAPNGARLAVAGPSDRLGLLPLGGPPVTAQYAWPNGKISGRVVPTARLLTGSAVARWNLAALPGRLRSLCAMGALPERARPWLLSQRFEVRGLRHATHELEQFVTAAAAVRCTDPRWAVDVSVRHRTITHPDASSPARGCRAQTALRFSDTARWPAGSETPTVTGSVTCAAVTRVGGCSSGDQPIELSGWAGGFLLAEAVSHLWRRTFLRVRGYVAGAVSTSPGRLCGVATTTVPSMDWPEHPQFLGRASAGPTPSSSLRPLAALSVELEVPAPGRLASLVSFLGFCNWTVDLRRSALSDPRPPVAFSSGVCVALRQMGRTTRFHEAAAPLRMEYQWPVGAPGRLGLVWTTGDSILDEDCV